MKKIAKILVGILLLIASIALISQLSDKKIGTRTGPTKLTSLSDVNVTSVSDGQSVVWDNATSRWINGSPSVDLSGYLSTTTAASTYYLQTNPAGYITSSALTPYLSTTTAATLYISSSSVDTLTNKRITPRVGSLTASTSLTIDSDLYDQFYLTAVTATTTFANPAGTPTSGQRLIVGITASTTAQGLVFGTNFATSTDLALPNTTVANKTMYLGFIWNVVKSKWILMALLNNI